MTDPDPVVVGDREPEDQVQLPAGVIGDLLAYGRQQSDAALKAKDREQYQLWQGWCADLERLTPHVWDSQREIVGDRERRPPAEERLDSIRQKVADNREARLNEDRIRCHASWDDVEFLLAELGGLRTRCAHLEALVERLTTEDESKLKELARVDRERLAPQNLTASPHGVESTLSAEKEPAP